MYRNSIIRKLLSLWLVFWLLAVIAVTCMAEETNPDVIPAGSEETSAQTMEDSSIVDAAELQQWMDGFVREHNLNQNYIRFSVGFWYSGTGDDWYYDADQWMYSASLYKVPVSMLMAEKEAAGELTQESIVNGTTLEFLESTALVYSNNDSGHSMVSWLGGSYSGKCSDMTIRFTDLPESYFDQDFYDVSYYTARYMTQVMRTLYLGGGEQFPHVLDYLKQAQPNDYYNRSISLKSYDIAQKFGAYEEANGNNNNHCAAVIYTPNPIVVTVMTRNAGDYQNLIAEVGGYLAEYSLLLDQKLENRRRTEAEQAAAEAAVDTAEPNDMMAAPAEEEIPTAGDDGMTDYVPEPKPETAVAAQTAKEKAPRQGLPTSVIILAAVLAAIIVIATVLLLHRRGREEDEDSDWEIPEEEEEAEVRRSRTTRKESTRPRNTVPAKKDSKKAGSAGEYRPKH